jgi:hypothetical protein
MVVKRIISIDSNKRTETVQMKEQEQYPYLIISRLEKPTGSYSLEYFNMGLDYQDHLLESFGLTCRLDERKNFCFSNLGEQKIGKTVAFSSENMLSEGKLLVVPSKMSSFTNSHSIMAVIEVDLVKNTLTVKDLGCENVVMQLERDRMLVIPQKTELNKEKRPA